MIPWRRLLLAGSAAAAILLTLDKTGLAPVAPGYDVAFESKVETGGKRLILTTDAGDLDCWMRLRVRSGGSLQVTRAPKAVLSTGHTLAIATSSEWIDVFEPDKDPANRAKFHWLSGTPLYIEFENGAAAASLEDWIVYLKDKPFDSLARATWRKWWFRISLVLFAVTVVGAILGAWPEAKAPSTLTAEGCLTQLIAEVEGVTKADSENMRLLLRKVVLEGVQPRTALDSFNLRPSEKWPIWFKARRQFLDRLGSLIQRLSEYFSDIAK